MTKTQIAKTVVEICRKDASFCNDVKVDPAGFLSHITDGMPEEDFLFAVEAYLAAFRVRGHLYFYKKGAQPYLGFRVRRYRESLFLTHAEEGLPLAKGDEIVAVDGLTIEEAATRFSVLFRGDPPDRQGEGWEALLRHARTVTVRSRTTFEYAIRTDVMRGIGEPSCVAKRLNEDCYYLKFTNFFDGGDVSAVMDCAAREITRTKHLILDLRDNCGGNDTEFLPLLKFLLKENDALCGQPVFPETEDILFTERNAKERTRLYRECLEQASSEAVRAYLSRQLEALTDPRLRGFLPAVGEGIFFPEHGTALPERVVVLTDCDCASSAESLVEIASKLQKVTLIGRPTMGALDYSNLARADLGEYALHYPTSRSRAIDAGRGIRGKGISPNLFIPWTPQHIFADADLSAALALLKNS